MGCVFCTPRRLYFISNMTNLQDNTQISFLDLPIYSTEGPEVRIIAERLQHLVGKHIDGIAQGIWCTKIENLDRCVFPLKITKIGTIGNMIWFDLEERILLIKHSRMSFWDTQLEPTPNNLAIELKIHDEDSIFMKSKNRFVIAKIIKPQELRTILTKIYSDIFNIDVSKAHEYFETAQQYQNKTVAEVLYSQTFIAGCGANIISEALYCAKISPWRPINAIMILEWKALLGLLHGIAMRKLAFYHGAEEFLKIPQNDVIENDNFIKDKCAKGLTIKWVPHVQL